MRSWVVAFLPLALAAAPVWSLDVSGRAGVGVMYSDNITRTSVATTDDTVIDATTQFLAHESSRRVLADVRGNLQYLDYAQHTYSSNVVGDVAGYGRFDFVPERFNWEVLDNFGQQQLTPGSPDTPDNRQNVNFFSTGPHVQLDFSRRLRLIVGGRYSRVSYETTSDGNNRVGGSVGLVRLIDFASDMSVNVTSESVRFESGSLNPDFTRRQVFGRYRSKGGRSSLVAEAGYDQVSGDAGQLSAPLIRIELTHEVSAFSTFSLYAGRETSDAGSQLRQLQSQAPQVQGSLMVQRSTDPFSYRYVRAGWRYSRNRTSFDLGVSRALEHHEIQTALDHTTTSLYAGIQRQIARLLTASVSFSHLKNDYDIQATDSSQSTGLAGLAWRVTRHVDIRAEYQRMHQSSPTALYRYNENRLALSIGAVWDPPSR